MIQHVNLVLLQLTIVKVVLLVHSFIITGASQAVQKELTQVETTVMNAIDHVILALLIVFVKVARMEIYLSIIDVFLPVHTEHFYQESIASNAILHVLHAVVQKITASLASLAILHTTTNALFLVL